MTATFDLESLTDAQQLLREPDRLAAVEADLRAVPGYVLRPRARP